VTGQLAEFLTRLSKKQLAQYLETEKAPDIEQVVSILRSDLDGVPAVLVYDDYHAAQPALRNFFYAFRSALEGLEAVKLVVAGRSVAPFYDRRDVRVNGTVRELGLAGLDPASSEKILQVRNLALPPEAVRSILRQTAGHPLFLELVDPSATGAADIHKYLEEELFSRITDVEAKVLTVASVFRHPVHADGLFIDDTVDAATIHGLLEQSLGGRLDLWVVQRPRFERVRCDADHVLDEDRGPARLRQVHRQIEGLLRLRRAVVPDEDALREHEGAKEVERLEPCAYTTRLPPSFARISSTFADIPFFA